MGAEFDSGEGTTPGKWQMVSDALAAEKLPDSINEALRLLCMGRARIERMRAEYSKHIEQSERAEYERLKAKFEGKPNV